MDLLSCLRMYSHASKTCTCSVTIIEPAAAPTVQARLDVVRKRQHRQRFVADTMGTLVGGCVFGTDT